jgi:2-dehydro-3-deoxy-D-gluconate 5-dehydrogenase
MKTNSSMFSVSGKVALVTGGRRGLGLAMALGLAEAGCRVAVAAASREHAELSRAFRKTGAELLYIRTDLCNRAQQMRLIPKVVKHFGRLDILVNNAGIQYRQPALDFDLNQWDRIIQLMLTAVFVLSRQAARVMEKQGGGKIVNIASLASFQGGCTVPAYTAAKHGVAGLTKALANEWAAKNINVNAIAPGYFETDMCAALRHDPVRGPGILDRIPAGRWGKPEDLIGALLFLAGSASNYVHGHLLVVDGGWMGR